MHFLSLQFLKSLFLKYLVPLLQALKQQLNLSYQNPAIQVNTCQSLVNVLPSFLATPKEFLRRVTVLQDFIGFKDLFLVIGLKLQSAQQQVLI